MKNKFFPIFLFIVISTCKLFAQYEVTFSDNYPPYNFTNEKQELVGFNIDILNAINNLYEDTDIQLNSGDWRSINKALDNGTVQAIGGAHYPGSYDENYIYTRSTINTSHCFFYNTKYYLNFSLEKFRTIKNPLVAMWKNDVLVHYVLSINPSAKFVYIKNYEELIQATDREDITCLFGQRIGGLYFAEKFQKNYIKTLDHRILERNMGFKVSKNAPELAEILNNGLEVIMANGTYEEIYNKWISGYEKPNFNWKDYIKYILVIAAIFLALLVLNWILRSKVKNKTKDLSRQIEVNANIMQQLEIQKFKAEESDRMKSAFLANMSHEIRTPMNGILGFTELLKDADYSAEKRTKFIDIIQQSGNRMLNTINNIVDISKLESGLEVVQIKPVDINAIVCELVDFFSHEAALKGLNFTLHPSSTSSPTPFYCDAYKLNSILTNLIKNALKFTLKGGIEIKYNLTDSQVEFWVTDTGIGIPLDKQATIFDEFVQADSSHSSGYEGSGLGLSISKGYVHLLKGKITLTSTPNKGTSFYVCIPNSTIDNVTVIQPKEKKNVKTHTLKTYKIIIAEDDSTTFYFLKEVLKDVTKQMLYAKNGNEVIELVKKHPDTDFILMDIKMPYLNGFEATKIIRSFNKDVYIIGHTAFSQDSYKQKILKVGCNAYISKPINREKLLDIIKEIK